MITNRFTPEDVKIIRNVTIQQHLDDILIACNRLSLIVDFEVLSILNNIVSDVLEISEVLK